MLIVDGEITFQPVYPLMVFKMFVKPEFIVQIQEYEEGGGESQRQTKYIDDGIEFIPAEIP
jgi:hypothetical protein